MKKLIFMLFFSIGLSAQSFDFECNNYIFEFTNDNEELLPFVIEFVADAKARGHEIEVEDIYGAIVSGTDIRAKLKPSLNGRTFGLAVTSCSSFVKTNKVPPMNFIFVKEFWAQLSDYYKKRVIYHELGHSIFNYRHTTGLNEIMTGGNFVKNAELLNATHRFFSGENQIVYDACTGVEEAQDIYFNTGIDQDATPLLRAINFTDLPGVNGRINWYSSNANYSHIKEKGTLNWENIIATDNDVWSYDFDLTGLVDKTFQFLSGNYNNESRQSKMRIIKAIGVTNIDGAVVTIELPKVLIANSDGMKIHLGPFNTELTVNNTSIIDNKLVMTATLINNSSRQRRRINQLITPSGPKPEVVYVWFEKDI